MCRHRFPTPSCDEISKQEEEGLSSSKASVDLQLTGLYQSAMGCQSGGDGDSRSLCDPNSGNGLVFQESLEGLEGFNSSDVSECKGGRTSFDGPSMDGGRDSVVAVSNRYTFAGESLAPGVENALDDRMELEGRGEVAAGF